jgi:hypothetical protein
MQRFQIRHHDGYMGINVMFKDRELMIENIVRWAMRGDKLHGDRLVQGPTEFILDLPCCCGETIGRIRLEETGEPYRIGGAFFVRRIETGVRTNLFPWIGVRTS